MERRLCWNVQKGEDCPSLRGRINADVAIVGGGLSGLACALWLSRTGLRVALAEAETLGSGISGNCAGVIALTNGILYSHLEKLRGIQTSQRCAVTLGSAMHAAEGFAGEVGLAWQRLPLYMEGNKDTLEKELEAMRRAGIRARWIPAEESRLAAARIALEDAAVVHPEKYIEALVRCCRKIGVQLFEHSRVIGVEIQEIHTERGSIHAPYMIIATGYPIVNVPGWYFLRMEQYENRLIYAAGTAQEHIEIHTDERFVIRPFQRGMLIHASDSACGNISVTKSQVNPLSNSKTYHALECRTPDGLPYIGAYGRQTPNLFVAAGYGGMGILGSMMAAQAITARILGRPSDGYEIYSGQRSLGAVSAPLKIGGRYVRETIRHPMAPRCPHMGCRLIHNPRTRLWECPCHGSRFDDIGHVLNAPAVKDAILENRRF